MCGNPGGPCTPPLTEALVSVGYRPLHTTELSDCGMHIMACGDGVVRSGAAWKGLDWELAAAVEARAGDLV